MQKMSKETILFERSPVLQAIARLALPTVVGQIILVVYNMADTYFVGLTGSEAKLTAVTICMPAFMILSAISNLFGVGGASVISRSLGAKNKDRARRASAFAFWGCLMTVVIYSAAACLLMDPLLNALGGSHPQVHAEARKYLMSTVVAGGFGTAMSGLLAHLVRSEGRSVPASFGVALGGVLNIALDPLFMFVVFPKGQEALGAGVATGLSNLIAMAYFLAVVCRRREHSVLSLKPDRRCLEKELAHDILSTGLPACLMTLCENISYAVLDALMATGGVLMQAGVGVTKKVNMLAHCIVRGMTQGVLPLLAYNYAAGNYRRMRRALRFSTLISVGLASVCMAFNLMFSRELIGIFIREGSGSLEYGARFLRILCIGGPFSACAYAIISFFQAVGKGRKSFVLAILRKGLLDIPMMFLLREVLSFDGIVWATPVTDVICCAAALTLAIAFLRNHENFECPHPGRLTEALESNG